MIYRLFAEIKDQVETLFGGARSYLFEKADPPKVLMQIKRTIILDDVPYYYALYRGSAHLTEFEKRIFGELVKALSVLYNGFSSTGYIGHFRTAVSTALTDVTIARYLRGDRLLNAFWSVQSLIQALKHLSFERYEGDPATTGFFIERIGLQKFKKYAEKSNFSLLEFDEKRTVNDEFFGGPLSYRYVDGQLSMYLGRIFKSEIRVSSVLNLPKDSSFNVIDRLSHSKIFNLLEFSGNNSFAAILNKKSEIEVLNNSNTIFVWRKGKWVIFDPDIFYKFLDGAIDNSSIRTLLWTVYALSKIRHGALILIGDLKRKKLDELRKGSVAGKHKLSLEILKNLLGKSIDELKHNGQLLRILSADGLTVFDSESNLVETGFIIDTSKINRDVTGGGRTTAAIASSKYGKVIKVSEDGPIEFYENENRIYKFG